MWINAYIKVQQVVYFEEACLITLFNFALSDLGMRRAINILASNQINAILLFPSGVWSMTVQLFHFDCAHLLSITPTDNVPWLPLK